MTEMKLFLVGGKVRDDLLGVPCKDADFTVVGPPSLEAMVEELEAQGFNVHKVDESTFCARAGVPASMPELRAVCKDADFVLARKESSKSDGRRPENVEVGTLDTDLARRDFTINAMAKDMDTGALIDPHGGFNDLVTKTLRFVGDPALRMREDGTRVLRGLRFIVTKGFTPEPHTWAALNSQNAIDAIELCNPEGKRVCSVENMRNELEKMFKHDTLASLDLLQKLHPAVRNALFPEGLRLSATMAS